MALMYWRDRGKPQTLFLQNVQSSYSGLVQHQKLWSNSQFVTQILHPALKHIFTTMSL